MKFSVHEKIFFQELPSISVIATALLRVTNVQTSSTKESISPQTKISN